MAMDRTHSSRESTSSSCSSPFSPRKLSSKVLAIECITGTSRAEEWSGDLLQTGDIVEEIQIADLILPSPFKDGKSGVQKHLHSCFKKKFTSIRVRVRRSDSESAELNACIVPDGRKKQQYVLRAIDDPNYAVAFFDRTESQCLELQVACMNITHFHIQRTIIQSSSQLRCRDVCGQCDVRAEFLCLCLWFHSRMVPDPMSLCPSYCVGMPFFSASRDSRLKYALTSAQLQDGCVSYPWEKKMREMLQIPNSSCFLSILFLPRTSEHGGGRYDDLEDTLARANAWLNGSQASGVPVVFTNIQTESLLTKISGEAACPTVNTSSISDLPNLANISLYGFEDYHGVDIGVVRSVRLWYSPTQGEYPLEMEIKESDVKLGFVIRRTEEGFIYISSVLGGNEDTPAARSGLNVLHNDARRDSKLLVISRVNNQKVLPWIVSSSGAIRCFDTVSLSQKLSLHRHARIPLLIHVLKWDQRLSSSGRQSGPVPLAMPLWPEVNNGDHNQSLTSSIMPSEVELEADEFEIGLARDTAGEDSFRFHNFLQPDNWV